MATPRVAFATCRLQPGLYAEEAELLRAAPRHGFEAVAAVWDDPAVAWAAFDLVVVRSTWDYFERPAAFRAWLDELEASGARVENPVPLLRWNLDKRYLEDLAAFGVKVVPTRFLDGVEGGDPAACIESLLQAEGWADAVLKPAVSAGAFRTVRLSPGDTAAAAATLTQITAEGPALLQPFVPEIVDDGEWSVFLFGGEPSHAVIKQAAAGDYRVQSMYGGTARAVEPDAALLEAARAVERALPLPPLYLRVDGVRRGGEFLLMEAEAIEPYLFLGTVPEAAERYLAAVARAAAGAAGGR